MIETADAAVPQVAGSSRRRVRLWIVASVVLALVAAAVVAAVAATDHYRHAPVLESAGGGWLPPDNAHTRFVEAGAYTALVTRPRPGHAQTFAVDVVNPSSVTQTVVGLAYDSSGTAEPDRLSVSAVSTAVGDSMAVPYTSRPVAIPPQGVRTLRFTHGTAGDWGCRRESWAELPLRVRVGWFTRTEVISLDNSIFELRGPHGSC